MPQRLGNKVIVNRMMLTVIRLVSNREIPKRNIAHHRIETLVGESGLFKPMRLDLGRWVDRKSTRLNSSHVSISYAVFCLKKKNTANAGRHRLQERANPPLPTDNRDL